MTTAGTPYGEEKRPLAVAHRGGSGLAPENTMRAVELSYSLGYRYVELDVRATRDGVCVAFHDRQLRRLAGVNGTLASRSWQDLGGLRVLGTEPVPRLEEFLAAWPDVRWCLDLKEAACLHRVLGMVRRLRKADEVCLAGLPYRTMASACVEQRLDVRVAAGWRSVPEILRRRRLDGMGIVHVPVTRALPLAATHILARAHDLGLKVVVWTVNRPTSMDYLLSRGVDGVITDRPDLLREVLISRGQWQRPIVDLALPQHPSDDASLI